MATVSARDTARNLEGIDRDQKAKDVTRSGGVSLPFVSEKTNQALTVTLRNWIATVIRNPSQGVGLIVRKMSYSMFLMLPLLALLLKAAYRRRLFAEHAIFSMHLHSAFMLWFAALLGAAELSKTTWPTLGRFLIVVMLLATWPYAIASLKRVYQESLGWTVTKAVGVWIVYTLLWLPTISVYLVIALALDADL